MTVTEAITRADAVRPNTIDDYTKAEWLFRLEADIAECMKVDTPENHFPDEDQELLMPAPRDDIYPMYLCAMIDNANEETDLYQNDYTVSNAMISDAKRWWRRYHNDFKKKVIKV